MERTVVITGGTSGVGLATAELFAKQGWNVGIIARHRERLEETSRRLAALGARVATVSADVADADAINQAADRFERELGPIDAWVNNAMSTVLALADQITAAEYERVTATTYLSQVYGTLAVLKYMKPRRRGVIVQISSGIGIRSIPLQAPYCAAKFAVLGFTDSLRSELAADRNPIALSVIYLPSVNTPQPSQARNRTGHEQILPDPLYDPRLCAKAILYAVEHPQREFWVGRLTALLAIGQAAFPELADRLASRALASQLGRPAPEQVGNLIDPTSGPARVDGGASERVVHRNHDIFTSRQRIGLKLVLVAGVAIVGSLLTLGASRLLRRR